MARKKKIEATAEPKPKPAPELEEQPSAETDAEGHMLLPNPEVARVLAAGREREIRKRLQDRAHEIDLRRPFRKER